MRIRGRNSFDKTFFLTFSVSKASSIVEACGCQRVSSVFASWKGDGCMKDTDHPIRHPGVHLGDRASAQRSESYARENAQYGRGMAACWAGATPLFATCAWPKDHWGRSSLTNRTSGQTFPWTGRGSSDAVFPVAREGHPLSSSSSSTIEVEVKSSHPFTSRGLHQSLHGERGAMLRRINAIHAPKSTELQAHGNDGMAGATPPFDARCVRVAVRSFPPQRNSVSAFCAVPYTDPRICQT
jgi:hypothetical protein